MSKEARRGVLRRTPCSLRQKICIVAARKSRGARMFCIISVDPFHGLHNFISCQEEYSLLARDVERDTMPVLDAHGLGLIPFRPLADGLLTGKYRRDRAPPPGTRLATMARAADRNLTDANWAIVEALGNFAAERGHTLLELAFSWLAHRPAVASVIAGATTPEQVEQNAGAAGWALTPAEMLRRLLRLDDLPGRQGRASDVSDFALTNEIVERAQRLLDGG